MNLRLQLTVIGYVVDEHQDGTDVIVGRRKQCRRGGQVTTTTFYLDLDEVAGTGQRPAEHVTPQGGETVRRAVGKVLVSHVVVVKGRPLKDPARGPIPPPNPPIEINLNDAGGRRVDQYS